MSLITLYMKTLTDLQPVAGLCLPFGILCKQNNPVFVTVDVQGQSLHTFT